jgi:predicted HAD superfamily phosphohydrolase YqeG
MKYRNHASCQGKISIGSSSVLFCNGIENMPFEAMHQGGKNSLILDGDGTVGRHSDARVDTSAIEALNQAREQGHITNVAYVSNNPDKDLADIRAKQLGITPELTLTPDTLRHRKPGQYMIRLALKRLDADPTSVVGVGDGLTDLHAYYTAGLDSVHVHKFGHQEARGYVGRPTIRRFVLGALHKALI